jgi:hypothetical protein
MTRNQSNRDEPYGLQPVANVAFKVAQAGGETWAESMHNAWRAGFFAPGKPHDHELKLRAMFRAIRMLEVGDAKQQGKAREMSRFLELTWGLSKAYVTAGEGDIDATRELRERWGDAQLPPKDGGFVDGIAADEALIRSIIRRLK